MRRVKGWMPLQVTDIINENHDTKTLVLVNEAVGTRAFDFIAGQYLTFRFDNLADKPVVRSYTMSGSPCQPEAIYVTVKKIPNGLVSSYLVDRVKKGDILKARGPIGKFVYDIEQDPKNVFMIAAGSGVTPFTSIIREYGHREDISLNLLVAFRSKNDLINWDVLSKEYSNTKIITALTRDRGEGFFNGRPDDQMLTDFFDGNYKDITVLTCGPQALMQLTIDHCKKNGFENVKIESFFS